MSWSRASVQGLRTIPLTGRTQQLSELRNVDWLCDVAIESCLDRARERWGSSARSTRPRMASRTGSGATSNVTATMVHRSSMRSERRIVESSINELPLLRCPRTTRTRSPGARAMDVMSRAPPADRSRTAQLTHCPRGVTSVAPMSGSRTRGWRRLSVGLTHSVSSTKRMRFVVPGSWSATPRESRRLFPRAVF